MAVWLRNGSFDMNILSSEEFDVPVISVGNLTVGGTGKTPHIEYLIRLLKTKYRVAVLSRGYKRKTSGFVLAAKTSSAQTVGDESYQIFRKFSGIIVAVDANRRRGIRRLLALPDAERPEVILLDDAFQHRYVKPSLSILLSDYNRPFFKDRLLPAGRLREPAKNAKRADIVIITKCRAGSDNQQTLNSLKIAPQQTAFCSALKYGKIERIWDCNKGEAINTGDISMILVTGIANPAPLIRFLNSLTVGLRIMLYGDHHDFTKKDFEEIRKQFETLSEIRGRVLASRPVIVSTEKDMARLAGNPYVPDTLKQAWCYLPVEVTFMPEDEKLFIKKIEQHVAEIIGNRSVAPSADSRKY
jgi:tetraacyldisaccharide 4'-kinase